MDDQLPKGWVKTTLGLIVEPCRDRATPAEHPSALYVGLENIESHTMRLLGHTYARQTRSSCVRFSKGDVLYGKMRPYLNKVWVAEFAGLCSTEFLVFQPTAGLNSQFLALRLTSDDFVSFANNQVSGERPRVDFQNLSTFPILLPPTTEQDRIVAKVSAAMHRIDRAQAAVARASERLNRYRSSVLHAAVNGELTHAWRVIQLKHRSIGHASALLERILADRREHWLQIQLSDLPASDETHSRQRLTMRYVEPQRSTGENLPNIPESWAWTTIDQLTTLVTSGSRSWKAYYSTSGALFIRSQNIRTDSLELSDVAYVRPPISSEGTRTQLRRGDVLVTITGSNIGRTAVVSTDLPEAYVSQHIGLLRFVEPAFGAFAQLYIASPDDGRRRLLAAAYGAGKPGLKLDNLRELPIPLPTLLEQQQIVAEVRRRLDAADRLAATINRQIERARTTRTAILRDAFRGVLVPQSSQDEPASLLLERIVAKNRARQEHTRLRKELPQKQGERSAMQEIIATPDLLRSAWRAIDHKPDARLLFEATGLLPEHVVSFYEALRDTTEIRTAFQHTASPETSTSQAAVISARESVDEPAGRFRLIDVWLDDFKNLRDYVVKFDPAQGIDVVLGWNGTGKSNLFEALVIIFRDLHEWSERNRWSDRPLSGFRLRYEMSGQHVEIRWAPATMKRPELRGRATRISDGALQAIRREDLPLPRFVFGYYSGPTNRLADHFLPMKQAHYERLRKAKADDAQTLADLLEQRRFFCAETHHAKYVLLAFSYKEDQKISEFLAERLRIVAFESALFVIRKPRWAKPGSRAEDFWGATGIMRRVMERLRRFAIAPLVLEQKVSYGYRTTTEDHYYFFLPDLHSLHAFAAEYADARTFFLALESTDFSELIHDVKIQVRVKAGNTEQVSITFHQLSEGEQQLLMVLGLMRFTKSHQSLVLLDEPDTHLNPHWSVEYLKDLTRVMSDSANQSAEQQTSQILLATHDPLVIAGLIKEQIHLLKRDPATGECKWFPATVNPRGLGFTGILTSDMFGFRSDLDSETLADLDAKVRLVAKEDVLTPAEEQQLAAIDKRLTEAGFTKAFSDPYYAAFVRAWGRRYADLMAGEQFLTAAKRQEIDKIAREVLEEAVAEVEGEVGN